MWSLISSLDFGVSDTLVTVCRYELGSVTGDDRKSQTQFTPTRCPSTDGSVTTPTAPPAANWTGCVAYFADLKVLAVSDGVAWIRQDTGAQV